MRKNQPINYDYVLIKLLELLNKRFLLMKNNYDFFTLLNFQIVILPI